ncbi:4Fe-4S binding protein [Malaciobacter marinus]|uniref:2-oxoglutarate:acceptor oxidoreductase n=1 Tax=Malaciobacter marinus TaxID=505249 RepID=A0A347TLS8_9BACT|nr:MULTISPECIES: 4Fe-4S binding protein [Malaciobacter]AXX87556.1 2-oxoglutarate:acceptor oxidoreductase, delta subunit [Malaciobacter marinus]PHO14478.1 2-oxoglutarate:acceptor oxidoreductase [Malaciobacter marinus]RYA24498.1 4Fe-4S dicluster domain-containing protein [Malaciobacter halophilus]
METIQAPENTPVWVDESRCKACDVCVSVCPAGVLAMRLEPGSTLGSMVSVENKDSCIGCMDCELSCPDFAIFVADKKEFKFAKLTDEAKQRSIAIKNNNYRILS